MINIKFFARLSSMFVRNRWEIYTSSPSNKDGKMVHFGFCAVSSLIFLGGGGEGEVGYGCCFIFHDSVQDCSSMGSSYNLMIFWLKISMPGAADEISQNNR